MKRIGSRELVLFIFWEEIRLGFGGFLALVIIITYSESRCLRLLWPLP